MPKLYIPARDPRHRSACFALYRALLRQVPNVQLPEKLAQAGGAVNPIKHSIRKSFRRNKTDISPRLVVSALSNGYKFLSLLSMARSVGSPEHKTVLDFLTRQQAEREKRLSAGAARASAPPRKTSQPLPQHPPCSDTAPETTEAQQAPPPQPTKPRPPLLELKRTPIPYVRGTFASEFEYEVVNRPRPKSELGGSGIRRVPVITSTSQGVVFVRLKKPQPRALGPILRRLVERRQRRLELLQELEQDGMWCAEAEDRWEDLLVEHAGLERSGAGHGGGGEPEGRFRDSVTVATGAIQHELVRQRNNGIARAEALIRFVEAEKALAEQEKEEWKREKSEMMDGNVEGQAVSQSVGEKPTASPA